MTSKLKENSPTAPREGRVLSGEDACRRPSSGFLIAVVLGTRGGHRPSRLVSEKHHTAWETKLLDTWDAGNEVGALVGGVFSIRGNFPGLRNFKRFNMKFKRFDWCLQEGLC